MSIIGKKFGKLTVKSEPIRYKLYQYEVWCDCDCGNECVANFNRLKRGRKKSCGCLEGVGGAPKHGKSGTPIYAVWNNMLSRCYNPKHTSYKDYGARGIEVCDKWKGSFEAFYEDMGDRPSDQHSIERLDVDGNYEKSNCTWATLDQQKRNKRWTIWVNYYGEDIRLVDLCERLDMPLSRVRSRLYNGEPIEMAVDDSLDRRRVRKTKPKPKIELDGEYKTLEQWCLEYGKKEPTVKNRMKRGMSLEEALKTGDLRGKVIPH